MPWLGASESRTLRGMTVSKTCPGKCAAHVLGHLVGEVVARVEHGQQDALDLQLGLSALLHQLDGAMSWQRPSSA